MRAAESFQAPTGISPQELIELMVHGSEPAILDLRPWPDFCAGHVPGSHSVAFDGLMGAAERFAEYQPGFVFVCQHSDLSELARQQIAGDDSIPGTVLEGGFERWVDVGGDVEAVPLPWPLERQIRFVAGAIVVLGLVLGTLYAPARWIVGGIGCGLMFSGVSGRCGLGNLLLRAPFNERREPSIEESLLAITSRP